MSFHFFFFVAFSIGYVNSQCQPSSNRSAEARLREKLLCNYNKTVRPVKNFSNVTNVHMQLYPMKIFMDHYSETLSVHGNILFKWDDQYLTWDPREYEGIHFLKIKSSTIWQPDISIDAASAHMQLNMLADVDCHLRPTGEIYCFPLVNVVTYCIADLLYFPFDKQNCTLLFSSVGYLGKYVNVSLFDPLHGVIMDLYRPNKVWELLEYTSVRGEKYFGVEGNTTLFYPYLTFNFIIKRHSSLHQSILIIPSIGLVILSLLTFLMQSMYSYRIIACSVTIIGDILYLTNLAFWLPSNGGRTPIIITFYRDSFVIALIALITTITVKYLSSRKDIPYNWVSGLISKLETSVVSSIFLSDATFKEDDTVGIMDGQKEMKVTAWSQFAVFIDRASFIACCLFFIVLATFYLP